MQMIDERERLQRESAMKIEAEKLQRERDYENEKRKDEREYNENRRRDEREHERLKRQEETRLEEKRLALTREAEKKSQDMFMQMLAMQQANSNQMIQLLQAQQSNQPDPMASMLSAMTMIEKVKSMAGVDGGGDGELSPMAMAMQNLPAILQAGGAAIGGAIAENRSKAPVRAPNSPNRQPETKADPFLSAIPTETTDKITSLAGKFMAEGKDPAVEFNKILDNQLNPKKAIEADPAVRELPTGCVRVRLAT